jgi:DNA primase large subunit
MFPFREYAAVLDFFSLEARELVRSSPPLTSLPGEVVERAVERLLWRTGSEMTVGFSPEEVRREVLSFFLMCQALASVSYPYSREVRLAGGKTEEVIRYRLYHLFKGYESPCLEVIRRHLRVEELGELGGRIPREDLFRIRNSSLREAGILLPPESVPPQHQPRYSLPWTDLAPLLKVGRVQLTDLYLVGGRAVVTPYQLWDLFSGLMGLKCEEYVASLYERFSERGEPPEVLVRVGERISSLLPPEVELGARFPRGKLKEEFFPPCVKRSLAGVGSGGRNYAITVLLTSFLSHARLPPPGRVVTKIRDLPEGFSVVKEEIIPLLFEAAERCRPPLFRDQPQEKANVYYHLGFGMTTDPRPEDSGRSKWYRPPNCRKISSSAPFLCTPDEWCREIKNPLTYYYKRLRLEGRRDGVSKGDTRREEKVLQGGVEQP